MEGRRHQSVSVAVRIRPPHAGESESGWTLSNSNTLHEKANPDVRFSFDYVFTRESTTRQIYDQCVAGPIVQSCMNGFNATVFAYGQTSSGKSYTMLGGGHSPGIVPLAVEDIFSIVSDGQDGGKDYVIKCSMLEIYNEQLRDLLADPEVAQAKPLRIVKSPLRGVYVDGAIRRPVTSKKQFIEYIHKEAEARRITKAHDMNDKSSRSHCIVRIDVECWENVSTDASTLSTSVADRGDIENRREGDSIKVSALHLVDLAGSERISKTGVTGGDRKTEGAFINKSLLFLGTVIERLSDPEGQKKGHHIPYRDSLLTRMLESSLGGNSATTVIAAITEAENHRDETRSTLQFAFRASRVRNLIQKNEVTDDKTRIAKLTSENKSLRKALVQRQFRIAVQGVRLKNVARHGTQGGATGNASLSRLTETLQRENTALISEIEALRQGAGPAQGPSVNEEKFAAMKSLVSKYETQVEELEGDLRVAQEGMDTLEGVCRDLEQDNESKAKKVDRFRKDKKTAEAASDLLRQEKASLEDAVLRLEEGKRGFAQKLESELAKARTSTDSDLQAEIASLRSHAEELEEKNRALLDLHGKSEAESKRQQAGRADLLQDHKEEVARLKLGIAEQAQLCRRLLQVTDEMGESKPGASGDDSPPKGEVKPREVDSAVKLLKGFIASRKHHPPGVVQSSSASFLYEPPVSQLPQLAKNNVRMQSVQEEAAHADPIDEGFSDTIAVRIKGMSAGEDAPAPVRRKRPTFGKAPAAEAVERKPSTPTEDALPSYLAEISGLKQTCASLQEALSVRDSQRDVIVDTKLKRMQDLVLRIYNNWLNLQHVVRRLAEESVQLKEFVKLRKLSHKLPANLKAPTAAADELIASAQSHPIRDHPSWPVVPPKLPNPGAAVPQ
eukprot:TRINITY_DN20585_c0_g1_i1.p1 TRINITY_DN20585_c0_g1~~TRINITY_DN20585_c0_g1_i1.p1  ORF type:complete len:909 (+),score=368.03 TRINITY_DN20585_c0_g1_i1:31-2727(+)